jgi:hypothetical protein
MEELVKIFKDAGKSMSEEEIKYCKNTVQAIEDALKRECKV